MHHFKYFVFIINFLGWGMGRKESGGEKVGVKRQNVNSASTGVVEIELKLDVDRLEWGGRKSF